MLRCKYRTTASVKKENLIKYWSLVGPSSDYYKSYHLFWSDTCTLQRCCKACGGDRWDLPHGNPEKKNIFPKLKWQFLFCLNLTKALRAIKVDGNKAANSRHTQDSNLSDGNELLHKNLTNLTPSFLTKSILADVLSKNATEVLFYMT